MSGWSNGGIAAAKELLEKHKSEALQQRRKKSFDLLWQALEEMRKAGVAEFKLADIGRKLESLGGPKTQTLRNLAGAAYREVIALYSAARAKPDAAAGDDVVGRALATVTNASARKIIADRLRDRKALEAERDRLRVAIASVSLNPTEIGVEPTAAARPAYTAPSWALNAFQTNLDANRLAERGISIAEDGSLQNRQGVAVFSSDFVDAVNELMRAHGRPALGARS